MILWRTMRDMNNSDILKIAMLQSAIDLNAAVTDFQMDKNVVVNYKHNTKAKVCYKDSIPCNLVSYGRNIVASVMEEYRNIVQAYVDKFDFYHCFETPNIQWLDQRMREHGHTVCFMAEFWLPDLTVLTALETAYQLKILTQEDFNNLYVPGVGAYSNGRLIGLAGCSADCDEMWQIGVDVLYEYRRQGVASALTSTLAIEILKRGKIPYYCCAWSNISSARNAIRSGFRPAWVEMTIKPIEIVDCMNE